jgi:hypothetical protein
MTTTPIVSHAELLPVAKPLFTDGERAALAGFLAGYSGLTRDGYTLDLRQYTSWCEQHGLHLFTARRADIESFGRDMEAAGRARATIARRLCTIAGFYRYAVEETCSSSPRPRTCANPGSIMSRTWWGWTVTRSVRCWSRPGSAPPPNTP